MIVIMTSEKHRNYFIKVFITTYRTYPCRSLLSTNINASFTTWWNEKNKQNDNNKAETFLTALSSDAPWKYLLLAILSTIDKILFPVLSRVVAFLKLINIYQLRKERNVTNFSNIFSTIACEQMQMQI